MYLGSVRFFRHLIITALVLLILLPAAGFAVVVTGYVRMESRLARMEATMEAYLQRQEEADRELKAAFDGLSSAVDGEISVLRPQISETGETVSGQITDFEDRLDDILSMQQQMRQDLRNLIWEFNVALKEWSSAQPSAD